MHDPGSEPPLPQEPSDERADEPRAPVGALTGLVLLALLGAWLAAAPFALGEQRRGAAWTAATWTDAAAGTALAAVAGGGLLAYLAAALAWLARYGRR